MSSITLSRHIDSDTLHLPELQPFLGHEVEIVVRDVVPLSGQVADRTKLLTEITHVAKHCAAPHWDGSHADAVPPATVDAANRLIDSLPVDVPLPTVTAEPDGQLNFEWYREPRKLLSVSVSASGTLYWAALIGSEDPRGSIQFSDQFPKTLLYWISQVYE